MMSNSMKYSGFLLLFVGVIALFSNCNQSKNGGDVSAQNAFIDYISAFTSGVVSNETSIAVHLSSGVEIISADQEELEDIFSLSPDVEGTTYWSDNTTVVFNPTNPLPSGTVIDVKFNLGKLVRVPSALAQFKFSFATYKQAIRIETFGLEQKASSTPDMQQLRGTLTTSDYVDPQLVEQLLAAEQESENLQISWTHQREMHQFVVENVVRKATESKVVLSWDGDLIGCDDSGERNIKIPSKSEFSIFEIAVSQSPTQCVTIHFSDPLKVDQELEGLVHFKDNTPIRIDQEGSAITIFPAQTLTSSKILVVEGGIESASGVQLETVVEKEVQFSSLKPDVQLIGKGVIMPTTKGLIFPFKAVNLSGVNVKIVKIYEDNIPQFLKINQLDGDYRLNYVGRIVYKKAVELTSEKLIDYGNWNSFALDLSDLIAPEPGAIYHVTLSFDHRQILYNCSDDSAFDIPISNYGEDKEDNYYADPEFYSSDKGLYSQYNYKWSEEGNPCNPTYYMWGNHSVSRNILASDLGIIVKQTGDNKLRIAVSNIQTTVPLSGVDVDIYNLQDRLLISSTTDLNGFVDVSLRQKPFLLIAKRGDQRGYLRLDDGSSLSMSMFDVGGAESKDGIKGFIYGERGVWRPGDTLFLSFILQDKQHVLPETYPVIMELMDPNNQLSQRKVVSQGEHGMYTFKMKTNPDDITGNWTAKVKVGGALFTKRVKLEAIKPNRLKINLDFGEELLQKGINSGNLAVHWLHGAIAKNLKCIIDLELLPTKTSFENYFGYSFDDPSKQFYAQERTIFDKRVNDQGEAPIEVDFTVSDQAPGMLNAKFRTRAFEAGGDFSTDVQVKKYSPFESYVGVKMPKGEGWGDALYSNESNLVSIVTVDEQGKPISRKGLKVEVFEINWRWWWDSGSSENLAYYVSHKNEFLIHTGYVDTKNGKADYKMDLNCESWGRKVIRISDPVSGHTTGEMFYTTYKGSWESSSENSPGGAEMLSFSTDKTSYEVGEEVVVTLPGAEAGRALVSLETGSRILETFWVALDAENHNFSFKTNAEMLPNIYINISLLQPHNQVKNDLPIRLYGVQSITIEDPKTHLYPEIKMQEEVRPESKVELTVSEKDNQPMAYSIAIVDDGLLDLTRFKTPNGWNTFYAKEALGVKTWDMYNYVIGAFSGEMAALLALGGDEQLVGANDVKANRFKPVVLYLGPFFLEKGEAKYTFLMPNYIGSVRAMVVAANSRAYGSAEQSVFVKKPLMALATLPRVLGPKEEVKLPVTLFAMDKKIKDIDVVVKTNDLLTVKGATKQTIHFDETGEQVIYFDLSVVEKLGVAKVQVVATSGREKATYDIELDVRLPNPAITKRYTSQVAAGESWETTIENVGMAGTNSAVLELSSMPSLNLEDRLDYLIKYPHGCVEQVTSSVFAQLYLDRFIKLSDVESKEVEQHIKAGINSLKKFQNGSGGLSYWSGGSDDNEWGTNYAGHFMLEAVAKGYMLPPGFLANWTSFQVAAANNWVSTLYDSQNLNYATLGAQLTQAYRLYTLALAGKPQIGAMNRMRSMKHLSANAKWRLAAGYALAGRGDVAKMLVKSLSTSADNSNLRSTPYGSPLRDQALILETLNVLKEREKGYEVMIEIAQDLSTESWFSTQTTAFSLNAIAGFLGKDFHNEPMNFAITYGKNNPISTQASTPIYHQKFDESAAKITPVVVQNSGENTLFASLQLTGIPVAGDEVSSEQNLQMVVNYKLLDGTPVDISSLEQGIDFCVDVTLTHPGIRDSYKDLALTQVFPSGWEIRNLRFEGSSLQSSVDIPEYQDIRDDRVYTYFDLNKNQSKTFRVILNASYEGKFYLPAQSCEAMYDNTINAVSAGKWVEVERQ